MICNNLPSGANVAKIQSFHKCSHITPTYTYTYSKCHVFSTCAHSIKSLLMLGKKNKNGAEVFLGKKPGLLSGNRGQIKKPGRSPRGIGWRKKTEPTGLNKRQKLLVKYTSTFCRHMQTTTRGTGNIFALQSWSQILLESRLLKGSDWVCGEPRGFLCLGLGVWMPELNNWLQKSLRWLNSAPTPE